jgi:hypothetical protein
MKLPAADRFIIFVFEIIFKNYSIYMGAKCSISSQKAVNPSREFIPGYQFQGEVIFREFSTKEDYDEHRYQYMQRPAMQKN